MSQTLPTALGYNGGILIPSQLHGRDYTGLSLACEINYSPGSWNHFKAREAGLTQLGHMGEKK